MAKKNRVSFEEGQFQMAPMIDVVFQLLIFFLTVSTFARAQSEEDIMLATAQSADKLEKGENSLVVNVLRNGKIKVNGKEMTTETLESYLRRVKEKIGEKSFEVIIRSDRNSKYGATKDVFRACARSGAVFVKLGVEKPETDKKGIVIDPATGETITDEEYEKEFGTSAGNP
jgi:biopolymer transport protein ExbD